eukprot:g3288.t1
MPRSAIRDVMDAAWALERELGAGERLIHLEVGQPNFRPPESVCAAAARAAAGTTDPALFGYIPNAGLPELRTAIADFHNRSGDGLCLKQSNVVVCHGAVGAISTVLQSICVPGDEFLMPDPGWPNTEMATRILGGVPVHYPLMVSRGWKPDPDAIRRRINENTKALFICSPSNPTGSVLSLTELEALIDVANEFELLVVSDEIYSQIYFQDGETEARDFCSDRSGYSYANSAAPSVLQCDNICPERTVVVSGVSKTWAMCGFRVGWIVTPNQELASTSAKLLEASISCGVPYSQMGALEALTSPDVPNEVEMMVAAYRERRDLVTEILNRHGRLDYRPEGAFYVLVRVDGSDVAEENGAGCPTVQLCRDLLREEHVAVSPGSAFGTVARKYVRVSLASSKEDLKEGVERLCRFLDRRAKRLQKN